MLLGPQDIFRCAREQVAREPEPEQLPDTLDPGEIYCVEKMSK